MAYWQRQLRRWQGSLESTHYITWSTKCCLYILKPWKILCAFGQKLEGKRGQRKTEWDHGWVKFSCSLISIYLLLKKTIILNFKEAYLDVLWKNCLPGAWLSRFLSFQVDGGHTESSASHWLCQEGSILFPKWSKRCLCPRASPPSSQPKPAATNSALVFPSTTGWKGTGMEHKVQSDCLEWEGSSEFALSFRRGRPLAVSAWFTKKPFIARP